MRKFFLLIGIGILNVPVLGFLVIFDLTTPAYKFDEEYNGSRYVALGPRPRYSFCKPTCDIHYDGKEWPFRVFNPMCSLWRWLAGYASPKRTQGLARDDRLAVLVNLRRDEVVFEGKSYVGDALAHAIHEYIESNKPLDVGCCETSFLVVSESSAPYHHLMRIVDIGDSIGFSKKGFLCDPNDGVISYTKELKTPVRLPLVKYGRDVSQCISFKESPVVCLYPDGQTSILNADELKYALCAQRDVGGAMRCIKAILGDVGVFVAVDRQTSVSLVWILVNKIMKSGITDIWLMGTACDNQGRQCDCECFDGTIRVYKIEIPCPDGFDWGIVEPDPES